MPRYLLAGSIILAGISLFWFPWPLTLVLSFIAALSFPPAALAYGVLADVLYYPGTGYLAGTLWGGFLTLLAILVRYVVKTRIM